MSVFVRTIGVSPLYPNQGVRGSTRLKPPGAMPSFDEASYATWSGSTTAGLGSCASAKIGEADQTPNALASSLSVLGLDATARRQYVSGCVRRWVVSRRTTCCGVVGSSTSHARQP